jgi:hypothetical protein
MPHTTSSYNDLLAFMGNLSYIDFTTLTIEHLVDLLEQAQVPFVRGSYVVDLPERQQTYGQELDFILVQPSGHHNKIHLDFKGVEHLTDFHLQTFLSLPAE